MSIRVAIAGVGNCASSLVQGVEYYKDTKDEDKIPGLMHNNFGGYRVRDIEFVTAFDVDALKVGKDLSEAIGASQNNTIKFADVPNLGVEVLRGPTNDGLGEYYRQMITESDAEPVDVAQVLCDKKVDVLVSYLPVGSEKADKAYAQAAMDAGCAFVNCLPVFIASDPEWAQKFRDAGVPIVGDDIKSQVGATITHRVLARLFEDRGVRLDRTYQLNVGGNMDFMNMLQRSRLESKKISKTRAVTSVVPHEMDPHNVHIGPSDYVAWLDDRKFAFVRLGGHHVRRCAAESGIQARGVGFPEFRRYCDRRRACGQDCARPPPGRSGAGSELLLHEVSGRAARGWRGPPLGGGIHQG